MQQLITNFLLQHLYCPLPTIGSLQLQQLAAKSILGEQTILAPKPYVELVSTNTATEALLSFIATEQQCSVDDANGKLLNFCTGIKNLQKNDTISLPHVGHFFIDADGFLAFESVEIPSEYLPSVVAEKVVHPHVAHNMLVGDTETNTAAMVEFYTETATPKKSKWWLWAAVFFMVAVASFAYLIMQHTIQHFGGNVKKVIPTTSQKTYTTKP